MAELKFHELLSEATLQGRVEVINALTPQIISVASDDEMESLRTHLSYMTDKAAPDEAMRALFTLIKPTESGAHRYLSSRLRNREMSRGSMGIFIDSLEDAAPASLLNCLYMGEISLARQILDAHRNQFPCDFSASQGLRINDFDVDCRSEKMSGFKSAADIKHCFEMMADTSLFLEPTRSEPGVMWWALDEDHQTHSLAYLTAPFGGLLPKLIGNHLYNPELAISLSEVAESAGVFKAIYSHFPVWLKTSDLAEYPEAVSFVQELITTWGGKGGAVRNGLDDYGDLRQESFPDQYGSDVTVGIRALKDVRIGLRASCESSWESNLYLRYLEHFVDDRILLGTNPEPGFTLAFLPIESLSGVELAPIEESNLQSAIEFAADFFPLDMLINLQIGEKTYPRPASRKQVYDSWGPVNLLKEVCSSKLREDLFNLIPRQMLHDAFRFSRESTDPEALIELNHRFGWAIEKGEKPLKFDLSAINILHEANYSLWIDESKNQRGSVSLNQAPDSPDAYLKILEMGGWPLGMIESSIPEALQIVNRRSKQHMSIAYLQHQGPEKVAKEARTNGEWKVFMSIFSHEQRAAVLQHIPEKLRNDHFSSDLGL